MSITLNLKDYKIPEVIPESYGSMFDFKGVYTDAAGAQHNVTVFDTSYFIDHVLLYYTNRKITLPKDNAEAVFHEIFLNWVNSRKELYLKQAYAYTLKYNPIENYSSTEQMIDDETVHAKGATSTTKYNNTDTLKHTPFDKVTNETTPYTKEETTTTPYTKETTTTTGAESGVPASSTTNSKMAFNSSTFVGTDKSESDVNSKTEFAKTGTETIEYKKTGKEKVETTWTGYEQDETKHTGDITIEGDGEDTDTRNYTLTKKGNIGVQTAAEMLQKEYDGLAQDLARRALEEFIDRYTFYSVSID